MENTLADIIAACPAGRVTVRHPKTGRTAYVSKKNGEYTNYVKCFGYEEVTAPKVGSSPETPSTQSAGAPKKPSTRGRKKKTEQ